jgi:hypothetical protein
MGALRRGARSFSGVFFRIEGGILSSIAAFAALVARRVAQVEATR